MRARDRIVVSGGVFAWALAASLVPMPGTSAHAQIACLLGGNPNACTVAPGANIAGNVSSSGDGFTVTNFGSVGSSVGGNGIFIFGMNPNLTLVPDSVIQGQIDLSGPGSRTLNVGPGLSIANTFVTGPTVINANGAPFVQVGNQVAVVDTTAMGQADEMLADLTSGIFNAVHARLSAGGGSGSNGSSAFGLGGSSLMGLGARMDLLSDGAAPADSSDRSSGVWGQAFGGHRDEEATATSAQATHSYVGGIAGLDG